MLNRNLIDNLLPEEIISLYQWITVKEVETETAFTAIHIAMALVKKNKNLLFVDLDSSAIIKRFFDLPEPRSVLDITTLNIKYVNEAIIKSVKGVDFLSINTDFFNPNDSVAQIRYTARGLNALLDTLKLHYDYIFIACGNENPLLMDLSLMAADSVLILDPINVSCHHFKKKDSVKHFLLQRHRIFETYGHRVTLKGIVFFNWKNSSIYNHSYRRYLKETYSNAIKIYDTELPCVHDAEELILQKQTLFESDPYGFEARRYILFAMELMFL